MGHLNKNFFFFDFFLHSFLDLFPLGFGWSRYFFCSALAGRLMIFLICFFWGFGFSPVSQEDFLVHLIIPFYFMRLRPMAWASYSGSCSLYGEQQPDLTGPGLIFFLRFLIPEQYGIALDARCELLGIPSGFVPVPQRQTIRTNSSSAVSVSAACSWGNLFDSFYVFRVATTHLYAQRQECCLSVRRFRHNNCSRIKF